MDLSGILILERKKYLSKIWNQNSIQTFSSHIYCVWFQSYGNARSPNLNGILFTQDTLPKKHSSICLLMKFFSCPILADRVQHTYFEIIHKYPGDNCPGYNGQWVGPSWVIVIIVARHNCLCPPLHISTYRPHYCPILDISSASKITRYKDPELDKQVCVTLSWHG